MTSERLFNSFIPPKKTLYSAKTNFWLRPWTCCEAGVIKWVHFLEGLPLKFGRAKNIHIGAISDHLQLWSRISPEGIDVSKIGKTVDQQQPLPCWAKKSWWALVNKQKSYRRTCWPFLSAVLCNLMQFHSPRGFRVRFSGTFAMWRCCERNFNYLSCLSSRTCGAGRPALGSALYF